ncbi:MAG: 6-pyruvoyl tetrahydrobiopterin synthase [candidate division NC10 bacterium]|nr:6-pyruvoyl tetrahydrobiopterin synthase [candidate division NC10 bacterium]
MSARAGSTESVSIVDVTQSFRFAAAHRMHNPRLSAEENRRRYGRCNHVNGHGHTYRLAVTIRGPIADETGSVEGRALLAEVVRERVLERFDQANLDDLITPADGVTSTTEVLTLLVWRLLDETLPSGRLVRLRVEETPNNFFEMDRGD